MTSFGFYTASKIKETLDSLKVLKDGTRIAISMSDDKKLLIIDTDCGVDDALAILLALSTHHRVLAFTSVFGNTSASNAANNVLRLTNVTNKTHIPVYVGCSEASSWSKGETLDTSFQTGDDGFGGVSDQYPVSISNRVQDEPGAVAFNKLVREHPGQVTLIALGPLTNLAVAHLLDSRFSSNLKELCVMGGNVDGIGNVTTSAEFNFHRDPEAAHRVLSQFECPIKIVPWELSFRQTIQWDWFSKWIKPSTITAKLIDDLTRFSSANQWPEIYQDGIPLPDLLAVALVLFPDLIEEEACHWVGVELTGSLTRGMMVLDRRLEPAGKEKPRTNVKIVTRINLDALKSVLTSVTSVEWIK